MRCPRSLSESRGTTGVASISRLRGRVWRVCSGRLRVALLGACPAVRGRRPRPARVEPVLCLTGGRHAAQHPQYPVGCLQSPGVSARGAVSVRVTGVNWVIRLSCEVSLLLQQRRGLLFPRRMAGILYLPPPRFPQLLSRHSVCHRRRSSSRRCCQPPRLLPTVPILSSVASGCVLQWRQWRWCVLLHFFSSGLGPHVLADIVLRHL